MAGLENSAETHKVLQDEVKTQRSTILTDRDEIVTSWTNFFALKKRLHLDRCELIAEMKEEADARDLIFMRDYRRQVLRKRARDLDSDDRLDREWKSQRLIVEPVGMHGLPSRRTRGPAVAR